MKAGTEELLDTAETSETTLVTGEQAEYKVGTSATVHFTAMWCVVSLCRLFEVVDLHIQDLNLFQVWFRTPSGDSNRSVLACNGRRFS